MVLEPAAFGAIASPRRREILRLVWDRELAAGDIHRAMPDVTFGAVSLQLRALAEALEQAGKFAEAEAVQRDRLARLRTIGSAGDLGKRAMRSRDGHVPALFSSICLTNSASSPINFFQW